MMRDGYEMATSANLPSLPAISLCKFVNESISSSFETSDSKLNRSSRPTCGDQSLAWVELKRYKGIVTIYSKVTPEHKVNQKAYTAHVVIDEVKGEVVSGQCEDCAAAQGGCKHLVALLFWLHRRSEEPSPTEAICYWKKSHLSGVKTKRFISLRESCGDKYCEAPPSSMALFEKFKSSCEENHITNMLTSLESSPIEQLSLHYLNFSFLKTGKTEIDEFFIFVKERMTPELCKEAEVNTRGQSSSKLWHSLRYGRITASKIYEAAHCPTEDGSLVNRILGAKVFETGPMKRGPYTIARYLLPNKNPTPKCYAQMQLQILFHNVFKGVFVVADPNFESNKKIEVCRVNSDLLFISDIMLQATLFWKKCVHKHL